MSLKTKVRNKILIPIVGLLLLNFHSIAYSQCSETVQITNPITVYDRAPVFSSRDGWRLGSVVKQLPSGTTVQICGEEKVGLFIGKKIWYRIEFNSGSTGWVFSDNLRSAFESFDNIRFSLFIIQDAQANTGNLGTPDFTRWMMLFIAFIFVIGGMFGKVAYDEIDNNENFALKNVLKVRKCIKALIVAPMVFAAFLMAGNFNFSNEISLVIFFCMAFQNGFFWQTVVPTGKRTVKIA